MSVGRNQSAAALAEEECPRLCDLLLGILFAFGNMDLGWDDYDECDVTTPKKLLHPVLCPKLKNKVCDTLGLEDSGEIEKMAPGNIVAEAPTVPQGRPRPGCRFAAHVRPEPPAHTS